MGDELWTRSRSCSPRMQDEQAWICPQIPRQSFCRPVDKAVTISYNNTRTDRQKRLSLSDRICRCSLRQWRRSERFTASSHGELWSHLRGCGLQAEGRHDQRNRSIPINGRYLSREGKPEFCLSGRKVQCSIVLKCGAWPCRVPGETVPVVLQTLIREGRYRWPSRRYSLSTTTKL